MIKIFVIKKDSFSLYSKNIFLCSPHAVYENLDSITESKFFNMNHQYLFQLSEMSEQSYFLKSNKIYEKSKQYKFDFIIMIPFTEEGIKAIRRLRRMKKDMPILIYGIQTREEGKFATILGCEYICLENIETSEIDEINFFIESKQLSTQVIIFN